MERLAAEELALGEVQELGSRLEDHIRHEERVLFPMIEEALDRDDLVDLGRRLMAAEAGDPTAGGHEVD